MTPKPLDATTPAFTPDSPSTQRSEPLQSTKSLEQIQEDRTEIQRQQVELMKKMPLPIPKPPVFSGNILPYLILSGSRPLML